MTHPTDNTAPANTTVNKTSTLETLKDKAVNLAHKVTGKGHVDSAHHNTPATTTTAPDHHEHHKNLASAKHGDVNPSASLSSVRVPDDGDGAGVSAAAPSNITQPEAIHDPNQPHHHSGALAAEGVEHERANIAVTHPQEGSHVLGDRGRHHKRDDPQHGVTSRLSGEAVGGDPSLSGSTAMQHPVM